MERANPGEHYVLNRIRAKNFHKHEREWFRLLAYKNWKNEKNLCYAAFSQCRFQVNGCLIRLPTVTRPDDHDFQAGQSEIVLKQKGTSAKDTKKQTCSGEKNKATYRNAFDDHYLRPTVSVDSASDDFVCDALSELGDDPGPGPVNEKKHCSSARGTDFPTIGIVWCLCTWLYASTTPDSRSSSEFFFG